MASASAPDQVILKSVNAMLTASADCGGQASRGVFRGRWGGFGRSVIRKNLLANIVKAFSEENNFSDLSIIRAFSIIFILFAFALASGNQILLTIHC